jgi:hypothetical protein
MKITKKQIKRIIKEEYSRILSENIQALVKKYASASLSINDAVAAALEEDPSVDSTELGDAMEEYYDEMMGY